MGRLRCRAIRFAGSPFIESTTHTPIKTTIRTTFTLAFDGLTSIGSTGRTSALPSDDEIARYAPDLYADPFYRALQHLGAPLQIGLAVALFFLGGWSWVVWGVFVRLVFCYHSTWLVNSAAHMLGYRTYRTTDRSTNCWWVAALSFGEGWHNNHHAFPFSARHGLRWFEIDMTWWHVKALKFLRLADRVRLPTSLDAAAVGLCKRTFARP